MKKQTMIEFPGGGVAYNPAPVRVFSNFTWLGLLVSFMGDLFSLNSSPARYRFENKSPKNFFAKKQSKNETNSSPLTVHRLLINETVFSTFTSHFSPFKKPAFTMAEVLITLGIIGLVAAMTMGSVINKFKEREIVAKLKKINTILSQALVSAIDEQGTVDTWDLIKGDDPEGSAFLLVNYFERYFKILSNCETKQSCVGTKPYKYLNGVNHIDYSNQRAYKHVVLSDGTLLIFHVDREFIKCTNSKYVCATVFVDTNGYFKGPNQFGKDFFMFAIKKDKIVPYGMPNFESGCNKNVGSGYGLTCGAWVLFYENMDYLHM